MVKKKNVGVCIQSSKEEQLADLKHYARLAFIKVVSLNGVKVSPKLEFSVVSDRNIPNFDIQDQTWGLYLWICMLSPCLATNFNVVGHLRIQDQ